MDYVKTLRKLRRKTPALIRGKVTQEKLHTKKESDFLLALLIWVIVSISSYLLLIFFLNRPLFYYPLALPAIVIGFLCALLYLCAPLMLIITNLIFHGRLPIKVKYSKYSGPQIFISAVVLSFGVAYVFKPSFIHSLWKIISFNSIYFYRAMPSVNTTDLKPFIILWIIAFFVAPTILFLLSPIQEKQRSSSDKQLKKNDFGLYLGKSTGLLLERKHGAAFVGNQPITLNLQDCTKNILVLGGIGGGKTVSIINPVLLQLLDQDCGGLIFDVKGNFKKGVAKFAKLTQRTITTIGPNNQPINLIAGLTPETAADYLRSGLILHGSGGGKEKHWLNAATNLAQSILGILHFIPKNYALDKLHKFIYNEDFRKGVMTGLSKLKKKFNERDKKLLEHYLHQYDTAFSGSNTQYQKDVMVTLNEVLTKFTHPDTADAFCAIGEDMPQMRDVLDGTVYLVDMPLDKWGMCGKVVYTFIKLRYFNIIKERISNEEWNQDRPVFFMCDEYQALVVCDKAANASDIDFWDKSREANNIGIISAQSLSSMYSAVGDKYSVDSFLQNFRQTICFSTDDKNTISSFENLIGKAETSRRSYGKSSGKNKMESSFSSHNNESTSLQYLDKSVVDSQLFRMLQQGQAIACLNIKGRAMDDVLITFPVDVKQIKV